MSDDDFLPEKSQLVHRIARKLDTLSDAELRSVCKACDQFNKRLTEFNAAPRKSPEVFLAALTEFYEALAALELDIIHYWDKGRMH